MTYTLDILTRATVDCTVSQIDQFTFTGWNIVQREIYTGRSGKIMQRTILVKTLPDDEPLIF